MLHPPNHHRDDHLGCYLQVSSGSGGLEAQDWADTLFSMYMAWCKRHKYPHKILFRKKADVGITQAAMEISAFSAFGWLRYEEGVHRRSRVSPYGQSGGQKRQTSFASVQVTPMNDDGDGVDDIDDILGDINDKDLEWEAFNGSGPGGQHRNTSNSSVRCTHRPTGIVVVVQDERTQYNAKVAAIRYLKFKLKRVEEEREKKLKKDKYDTLGDQTFGNQIRNYVYTPYQSIKDSWTKCELRGQAMMDALKNGNIDLLLRKSAEKFNVASSQEIGI